MKNKQQSPTDQILDLLLDALQARNQAREQESSPSHVEESPRLRLQEEPIVEEPPRLRLKKNEPETEDLPKETPDFVPGIREGFLQEYREEREMEETAVSPPVPEPELEFEPEPFKPSPHFDMMMRRLAVILAVLVVLINIPFNRYGTSLARALPDNAAIIIRDGLLLKGSGEEVYVLKNNQRRWITSLDAFEQYGYRWSNVQQVDDEFLARFEEGNPVHLLLKCSVSPHVYALENGEKRWIKDVPTFQAQGYIWEDIRYQSCTYIRQLPDGPTIPEGAGPPPQP